MNRYSIISIIALIVIITPIAYGLWGIYSVEQLQLRTSNDKFSYFDLANYEKIRICNPTQFFVSFSGVQIDAYYQDDVKGVFGIESTTLNPNSSKVLDINFTSENFSEAQYIFMHMDGEFEGVMPIRLDPNQMTITTTYQTKIIGIIPYQQTITQSGFEFTQMMNEDTFCDNNG